MIKLRSFKDILELLRSLDFGRSIHVVMNLTCLRPPAATVGNTYKFRIPKNLIDRVSASYIPFSVPELPQTVNKCE
ncbi:hypothetical protein Tco_0503109 [Tanacetum coccineum]